MIVVLSPSKSMDMEPVVAPGFSSPEFLDQSAELVAKVRRFSTDELMDFMAISENLAELNFQRFKIWNPPFSTKNAKQAIFAFTGDVYEGLDVNSLKNDDIDFLQSHLRILSGLYGLLKPLDLIQPYRLEMGRPLETRAAKNLYQFWRETITDELNRTPGDFLVNLASQEYFKAIDKQTLDKQVISPVFKDWKNEKFKIISFFAKKARGGMARYIAQNRITTNDALIAFNEDGYTYNAELSCPFKPVFTRTQI